MEQGIFVGVDLGGARGKTTAVAVLEGTQHGASLLSLVSRYEGKRLHDDALHNCLATLQPKPGCIAVSAPLTRAACVRCVLPACVGKQACPDPAVQWLGTTGDELAYAVKNESDSKSQNIPGNLEPYYHRVSEVLLHFDDEALPHGRLGASNTAVGARGFFTRQMLQGLGYVLNDTFIEVSPRATIAQLVGSDEARKYRRDADPWVTRAEILNKLDLAFAPSSGFSREHVLANDDCFDAVIAAYTAYLRAKEDWQLPKEYADIAAVDGWIWSPADRERAEVPDAVADEESRETGKSY